MDLFSRRRKLQDKILHVRRDLERIHGIVTTDYNSIHQRLRLDIADIAWFIGRHIVGEASAESVENLHVGLRQTRKRAEDLLVSLVSSKPFPIFSFAHPLRLLSKP